MTEKQFETLVRELETYAKVHPAQYKTKVALLAVTGYAYVLAVLGTVIALTIGCFLLVVHDSGGKAVLLKVGVGLSILATLIVRALWVRLEPPSGIEIQQKHAPQLFLLIEKIRKTLGTPAFHHVLIVNDLNAAVVQVPRLGIFGWQRNYLLLGLPLMLTFTPAQFRAVLAHEFGHLGRQHGRFASWIYRTRVTWGRLLQELTRRDHWASGLFTKFLGWYAPFFNAYSFVLARAQEYEADRNATDLVGPHCMKDTLASLAVIGRMLQESFWPSLDRHTIETAHPPTAYLDELAGSIQVPAYRERTLALFNEAMHEQTGYADTHPSLADRLAALQSVPAKSKGTEDRPIPQLLQSDEKSAASSYLGQTCDQLRTQFNREWADQMKETWARKHEEKQTVRARLNDLHTAFGTGTLTDEELWEYATATELLEGDTPAIPLYHQLADRSPDHAGANFALGRLLLAQGNCDGLARLERAAAQDLQALPAVTALAEHFLIRTGHAQEAAQYRQRAIDHHDRLVEAEQERRNLSVKDTFIPHHLPPNMIQEISTALSSFSEIDEAYLTRKQVRLMPEIPAYVLIIVPKYCWHEWREDTKNAALLARLSKDLPLPNNTYILALTAKSKRQWKKQALHRIPPLPLRLHSDNAAVSVAA